MKNLLKVFVILSLVIASTGVSAQSKTKLGHIDSNELMKIMPGRDTIQTQLENHAKELEAQFTAMQTEFNTKYQDFLANEKTYSELIRQAKQKELANLQERIVEFQESAQADLQKKEAELFNPLIEMAKKAIEEVAKANGYTYIFDSSLGVLLYSEPTDDILPLVKKKLGIN
ncbi:MAG: OmpH family outer membrane protein [Bacteroidales bacterium]|nr:OmpH family outer membrane protein [Bacteroidales bacterium]